MKPCVIFDLDGTLADTSGDMIVAANACLSEMGVASRLNPAHDAAIAVRGGRRMLTEGLARDGRDDPALVASWYPRFLELYGADLSRLTRFYPGALATVEALRASGYAVGICTNKPEALAEALLQALGARGLFDALVGADTLPVKKPDPAPLLAAIERAGGTREAALLVGDTDTDRKTARAAGVACVLVRFGPEGEDVAALNAEALITDFDELAGVTRRLIGAGHPAPSAAH